MHSIIHTVGNSALRPPYPPDAHLFGLIPMLLGVQDAPHNPFYSLDSILHDNLIVLGHLLHVDEPVCLLQQLLDLHLHVSEVGRGGILQGVRRRGGRSKGGGGGREVE